MPRKPLTIAACLILAASLFAIGCGEREAPGPPQPGVLAEMYGEQLTTDEIRAGLREMRERQLRAAGVDEAELQNLSTERLENPDLFANNVNSWSRELATQRLMEAVEPSPDEVDAYVESQIERGLAMEPGPDAVEIGRAYNQGLDMVEQGGIEDAETIRQTFEQLRPAVAAPVEVDEEELAEEAMFMEAPWSARWEQMVETVVHFGAEGMMRWPESEEEIMERHRQRARTALRRQAIADEVIEREGYLDSEGLLQEARQALGRLRVEGHPVGDMEPREALRHMLREREMQRRILEEQKAELTVYDPEVEEELGRMWEQRESRQAGLSAYYRVPLHHMR